MQKKQSCVLLLGGSKDHAKQASTFCRRLFSVSHVSWYPREAKQLSRAAETAVFQKRIDFLFNFLSPVIVPKIILDHIRSAALNFHPAPPEWPGVGSASFALYHQDKTFGVTAHLMEEKVDAGKILSVKRFPIQPADTCETLMQRAHEQTLQLFQEVLTTIAVQKKLPSSRARWKRKAISRKAFEEWITLSITDSEDEVVRKIRAVRHSSLPGPYLLFHGHRFELPPQNPETT